MCLAVSVCRDGACYIRDGACPVSTNEHVRHLDAGIRMIPYNFRRILTLENHQSRIRVSVVIRVVPS